MPRKPGGRVGRPPGVTPEERDLWQHVMRETRPLKKRARAPREPARAPAEAEAPVTPAPRGRPAKPPVSPPAHAAPQGPPPADLAPGTVAGVDRRTAERLKRGQLPVEQTLDLHGHTQAAAERELSAFLAGAQAAGRRCVLVITGKGTTREAGGVLRAQVPRWLNRPSNRGRVLAFAHAQPKHGGAGALYVLLRRRRDE